MEHPSTNFLVCQLSCIYVSVHYQLPVTVCIECVDRYQRVVCCVERCCVDSCVLCIVFDSSCLDNVSVDKLSVATASWMQ